VKRTERPCEATSSKTADWRSRGGGKQTSANVQRPDVPVKQVVDRILQLGRELSRSDKRQGVPKSRSDTYAEFRGE